MGKLITAAAVLVLLGAPAAMAQNSTKGSSGSNNGTGGPQAPVGHKQPRAGDVPSEKNTIDKLDAENAALDKKIKSICRGC